MGKLPKCRSIRDVGGNSRENPRSGLQAQTDPSGTFFPSEREPLKGKGEISTIQVGQHKLVREILWTRFGSKKQKSPNKQEITQRLHIRRKQTAWQEMHRQQGNVIAKISSPHIIVRIMRKIPVGFVHSPRIKSCAYK